MEWVIEMGDSNGNQGRPRAVTSSVPFGKKIDGVEKVTQSLTEDAALIRKNIRLIAEAHEVIVNLQEETIGFYIGDVEPAYILEFGVEQQFEKIMGFLAEWAKCHDQDSIYILIPDRKGFGFRSVFILDQEVPTESKIEFLKLFHKKINKAQLGAFVAEDNKGKISHIEFWGEDDKDLKKAHTIRSLLEQTLSELQLHTGTKRSDEIEYSVKVIRQDHTNRENPCEEYDKFIKHSKPQRVVTKGACLGEYRVSSEST